MCIPWCRSGLVAQLQKRQLKSCEAAKLFMKTLHSIILMAIFTVALVAPPVAAQVGVTWDKKFSGGNRFSVLGAFGNAAVLDKETGLVWEQSPSTTRTSQWDAQAICNTQNVGGRFGWRLPTIQELASLVDPTQSSPALTSGHPFSNVQVDACYVSATFADPFWSVFFSGNGGVFQGACSGGSGAYHWCVRGGQGVMFKINLDLASPGWGRSYAEVSRYRISV